MTPSHDPDWVLVPKNITEEMSVAGYHALSRFVALEAKGFDAADAVYSAMIASAPPPPSQEPWWGGPEHERTRMLAHVAKLEEALRDLVTAWDDAQTDEIPQPLWGRLYAVVLAARAIVEPTND